MVYVKGMAVQTGEELAKEAKQGESPGKIATIRLKRAG
jgi:hypothetical protein